VLRPFVSYDYRPAFFPAGMVVHIGYEVWLPNRCGSSLRACAAGMNYPRCRILRPRIASE